MVFEADVSDGAMKMNSTSGSVPCRCAEWIPPSLFFCCRTSRTRRRVQVLMPKPSTTPAPSSSRAFELEHHGDLRETKHQQPSDRTCLIVGIRRSGLQSSSSSSNDACFPRRSPSYRTNVFSKSVFACLVALISFSPSGSVALSTMKRNSAASITASRAGILGRSSSREIDLSKASAANPHQGSGVAAATIAFPSSPPAHGSFLPDDRFDPLTLFSSLHADADGGSQESRGAAGEETTLPSITERPLSRRPGILMFPSDTPVTSSLSAPLVHTIHPDDLHLLLADLAPNNIQAKNENNGQARKSPPRTVLPSITAHPSSAAAEFTSISDITPDLKAPEPCSLQKSKAFFGDQCVRLLQDGPPNCKIGEWLVLDEQATSDEDRPVAKCALKPCQLEDTPLLGLDGQCHNGEALQTTCRRGQVLTLDLFGRSLCDCSRHRVFWKDGNCYRVYRRGPCAQGLILVVEPKTSFISCQRNPCQAEGEALWTDGQCYTIGQQGPCNDAEVFAIDEETLVVHCEGIDLRNLFHVPWKSCPSGSRRDFLGQCESGFTWGSSSPDSACPAGQIRNRNGACVPWRRWG